RRPRARVGSGSSPCASGPRRSAAGSRSSRSRGRGRASAWRWALEEIRVVLADDHAVVRRGLRLFLDLQDGIEVVGEAADGREAIELVRAAGPDVVLMDLAMPELDGIAAA